jgi:tetratricopeptide (TPR) repeat protein
MAGPAPGC